MSTVRTPVPDTTYTEGTRDPTNRSERRSSPLLGSVETSTKTLTDSLAVESSWECPDAPLLECGWEEPFPRSYVVVCLRHGPHLSDSYDIASRSPQPQEEDRSRGEGTSSSFPRNPKPERGGRVSFTRLEDTTSPHLPTGVRTIC